MSAASSPYVRSASESMQVRAASACTTPARRMKTAGVCTTAAVVCSASGAMTVSTSTLQQPALRVPPDIVRIITDRGMLKQSDFSWSSVGGLVVGVALVGGGMFVSVVSGGAGTPALLASISVSTGLSGVMYSTTTAFSDSDDFDWCMFATESLVGGATAAATFGVSKGIAVAKGVKEIKDLSRVALATASAVAAGGVCVTRNAIEQRELLDSVLTSTITSFAGSFAGHVAPGKPGNEVFLATNKEIFRDIGLSVGKGAMAGALSAAAAASAKNVAAGRDLFENITDALKRGSLSGTISGSVSAVQITASRLVERQYHARLLHEAQTSVAQGGPAGALATALFCEANNECVLVINANDGHVNVFGDLHSTGKPPRILMFTPGDDSSIGHYVRLRNSTLQPVSTTVSGPTTCLVDAIGVTTEQLAVTITLQNARSVLRAMPSTEREALYTREIGGGHGKAKWKKANVQKDTFHRDTKQTLLKLLRNSSNSAHKDFLNECTNPDCFAKLVDGRVEISYLPSTARSSKVGGKSSAALYLSLAEYKKITGISLDGVARVDVAVQDFRGDLPYDSD